VAKRRQRRKREKEQRHAPKPVRALELDVARLAEPVARLVYSREQAAQALGISLATLDRRVIPTIATVKTEWGSRLIPAAELDRYLAERRDQPRARSRRRTMRFGRRSALAPEVVDRIRHEHARGATLAEIARGLNRDGIPTGQGGRQWWPSTVRAIVLRTAPSA
jgi:ribosomal protein L2